MAERKLIDWLRARIKLPRSIPVGPGDDAAVLALQRGRIVVTADAFLEGTHFPHGAPAARIGHKVIAASVSDIAAMGCHPAASFVTLGLNRALDEAFILELGEAMISAAETYRAPIAGGDITSWDGPLCVSVTVIGETRGLNPVLRSGARPGDRIFVTGRLGGSLLGRHFDAVPRIEEGILLNRDAHVTAMIDISDGLSTDLNHLAEESRIGAVIRECDIPVSDAAHEMARRDGVSAVRHALDDGEDFELLFTLGPDRADALKKFWRFDVPLTEIGEMRGDGVFLERAGGSLVPLEPHGYEHRWKE